MAQLTKQQLLGQLQHEQARWEALLAEVGIARMERPGVTGDNWTMKDTIAHLNTWWRREVARIEAIRRGERPAEHPPQSDVQIINRWIYLTNRDRPLAEVIHDAQATWRQLEGALQAIPDDDFLDRVKFPWWQGRGLGEGFWKDFSAHLREEHEPLIRAWLASQPEA